MVETPRSSRTKRDKANEVDELEAGARDRGDPFRSHLAYDAGLGRAICREPCEFEPRVATRRDSHARVSVGIARNRRRDATVQTAQTAQTAGRPSRPMPRVETGTAIYPNVNTLETLSPHLATFLSQPWLCERVIKWFMHSLDVFGEIRSNLSEQIAVELLFPV